MIEIVDERGRIGRELIEGREIEDHRRRYAPRRIRIAAWLNGRREEEFVEQVEPLDERRGSQYLRRRGEDGLPIDDDPEIGLVVTEDRRRGEDVLPQPAAPLRNAPHSSRAVETAEEVREEERGLAQFAVGRIDLGI